MGRMVEEARIQEEYDGGILVERGIFWSWGLKKPRN